MTTESLLAPLAGVRVLNLGGRWAGRLAALLLAEQGADVIELQRPGQSPRAEDALLGRGKRIAVVDLADPGDLRRARALAAGADIVIDNLRPGRAARGGLDAVTLHSANPSLVFISIPAFASGSPQANTPAWEGTVAASTGVYTETSTAPDRFWAAHRSTPPSPWCLPMAGCMPLWRPWRRYCTA